jgi:hypothetical protein
MKKEKKGKPEQFGAGSIRIESTTGVHVLR